jgi:hypothetical protein
MFGFKHTMGTGYNHHEVAQVKSRLMGRLIQVQGQNNLPKLFPFLAKRVEQSLKEQVAQGQTLPDGGVSVQVANTVRTLASRIMGVLFFGAKTSSDPVFADALLRYPKDMVSCMTAFQLTPSFLSS